MSSAMIAIRKISHTLLLLLIVGFMGFGESKADPDWVRIKLSDIVGKTFESSRGPIFTFKPRGLYTTNEDTKGKYSVSTNGVIQFDGKRFIGIKIACGFRLINRLTFLKYADFCLVRKKP